MKEIHFETGQIFFGKAELLIKVTIAVATYSWNRNFWYLEMIDLNLIKCYSVSYENKRKKMNKFESESAIEERKKKRQEEWEKVRAPQDPECEKIH